MRKNKIAMLSVCVVLLSIPWAPQLKADAWDKKTTMTFSAPVEIPGQVLSPGTYVFKLMDNAADRHIVQVFSADEQHVYATILAVPDERERVTGKNVVTFEERTMNSPQAIKAWFYPGDQTGNEFVYRNH